MYIGHSASFGEKRKNSLWNLNFGSAKILKSIQFFNENIYLKISNFTGKFFWCKKRIQNDRNTYENSFRIQKNFMKYYVRSQNVKFADFGALCGNTVMHVTLQWKEIFWIRLIFYCFQLDSAHFLKKPGHLLKKKIWIFFASSKINIRKSSFHVKIGEFHILAPS